MDIKAVKELATKYTAEELNQLAEELEQTGESSLAERKQDAGEQMNDFLQALEVRRLVDQGMELKDAVREFSKRVRKVLS